MASIGDWQRAEEFFGQFEGDDNLRGRKSAVNLLLLRGAQPRWSNQVSCIPVMGISMGFKSVVTDASEWVRVEPRPDDPSGAIVAVTLYSSAHYRPPGGFGEQVVGATICRQTTAPRVLESYLLQIGDEQLADLTHPFW